MRQILSIGIIGDHATDRPSHAATIDALHSAALSMSLRITVEWIPTPHLEQDVATTLKPYHALWCAPGDPYLSLAGALAGVRFAREHEVPFLGTCMGSQVAALEYARDVVGLTDAQHAEYNPSAPAPFIASLPCSITGQLKTITLNKDSKAYRYYGQERTTELVRCTMGMSMESQGLMDNAGFRIAGVDDDGVARLYELSDHPFFVATSFVPQMFLSEDGTHPLIQALLKAGTKGGRTD